MATANELLLDNNDKVFIIDVNSRTINIPAGAEILGVASDDEVQKLRFELQRYYNGIDLSEYDIRINYTNAQNEGDVSAAEDITIDEDTIRFTWVVDRYACKYAGSVTFVVCLRRIAADGSTLSEFNTTITHMTVLEGLETDSVANEVPRDVVATIANEALAQAEVTAGNIGIGKYIYLGVDDYGDPILWRCVGMRSEGALMVSDRILTYKAFDANKWSTVYTPAPWPTDLNNVRERYGSNRWSTSTLRLWLNAKDTPDWTAEKNITEKPVKDMVTANPYDKQKGFCNNFTQEELSFVMRVRNDTAVNENDSDLAYTGHRTHDLSVTIDIANNLKNYYDSAYLQATTDRFFCLNTAELVDMHTNLPGYTKAKPIDKVSDRCDDNYRDTEGYSFYWIRDAFSAVEYPEAVRCVYPSGREYQYIAHNGNIGVRPAFVLAKGGFKYGDGTKNSPYRLTEKARTADPIKLQDNVVPKLPCEQNPESSGIDGINIGDYVTIGKMDGDPILWRCVDVEDGKPLFVSDRSLRFFPFSGKYTGTDSDAAAAMRKKYGTNRWRDSAIRYWLNTDEKSENGAVLSGWASSDAKYYIPNAGNVYGTYAHYSDQDGFLSVFSQEERAAILTGNIKSALNYNDVAKQLNTTDSKVIEANTFLRNPPSVTYGKVTLLTNYNSGATLEETTDTIFLLSYPQLKNMYDRFEDYILAKPTEGAMKYCSNKGYRPEFLADCDTGKTWHYWTRDAFSNTDKASQYYPHYVCDVTTDGRIGQDQAYDAQYGIRPAFYANVETMKIISDETRDGSKGKPYIVSG